MVKANHALSNSALGFYGGDLKDINEGQGVFWPYKKALPIHSGLCKFLGTKETFLQEKRLQSHMPPFHFFLYTNMSAVTSYENALWFKYSSLPVNCTK